MIVILEIVGLALVLFAIWVVFRAAKARPDEAGLKWAARIALGAWVIFAADALIDFGWLWANPGTALGYVAVLAVVVLVILGYRRLLARVQAMANRN
jgi:ABC-type Na+ efflux pump permease subunit